MNKYLLLRDNKQTGPHSFEEMLELGFKKYDLVWVEGKSAAWRYPGEISEFAAYAPLVEEQPFDRFFKKAVSSEQVGGERLEAGGWRSEEVSKETLETTSGVTHEEIEKRRVALAESKPKQDDSRYLPKEKIEPVGEARAAKIAKPVTNTEERVAQTAERHKKVAITMPATRRSYPTVTPQPQKQEPRIIPVPVIAAAEELKPEEVPPIASISSGSYTSYKRDHTQYLQYAGVAAALISLLVVGILIGMGISTDTSAPVPVISEQPSRITELKEKLSLTAVTEPAATEVQYVSPEQKTAKASSIQTSLKKTSTHLEEATPVPASFQTSSAPAPVVNEGKREAVKREPAQTSNISEKISLNLNDYKVNMFGGIDGIEVSVKNGADVPVEEVVVELRYILSNKKKNYLTETVTFRDLKPGETQTLPGPKSNRGIKLESYIVSAR